QDPALDEHAWAEPCPELHMSPCRSPAIRIRPGRIIARSRLNSGAWCRCVGTVRSAILGAGTEGARARVGDAHFNFCRAALRPTFPCPLNAPQPEGRSERGGIPLR